jgi:hypothetical protein
VSNATDAGITTIQTSSTISQTSSTTLAKLQTEQDVATMVRRIDPGTCGTFLGPRPLVAYNQRR